jgi:thioredoxin reductase
MFSQTQPLSNHERRRLWKSSCNATDVLDVVIIGGGPAGLSAALVLGRCRRTVLLVDSGEPRNARSRALHGFLTRDGIDPLELLRLGRQELDVYGIEATDGTVADIVPVAQGFTARLSDGRAYDARMVLIASGVRDHLPDIPGLDDCYGLSVHHCPYCDGWENRDRTIAVVGGGAAATALGLSLLTWARQVVVCSHGPLRLAPRHRQQLAQHGIDAHAGPIDRIEHQQGQVDAIVLRGGVRVTCTAIFIATAQSPQSDLPHRLGCETGRHGVVKTDHLGQTCVPGLYVAGDASRDVQFAIVAAAEGAKAAVAMNKALQARAGLVAAS